MTTIKVTPVSNPSSLIASHIQPGVEPKLKLHEQNSTTVLDLPSLISHAN